MSKSCCGGSSSQAGGSKVKRTTCCGGEMLPDAIMKDEDAQKSCGCQTSKPADKERLGYAGQPLCRVAPNIILRIDLRSIAW
jgi:hypothetical protein